MCTEKVTESPSLTGDCKGDLEVPMMLDCDPSVIVTKQAASKAFRMTTCFLGIFKSFTHLGKDRRECFSSVNFFVILSLF